MLDLISKTLEILGEFFVVIIGACVVLMCAFGGSISITINGISRFFK